LNDSVIAVIEKNDCIYELVQGYTHKKYEFELYDALANAVYKNLNISSSTDETISR
jgi:hypothetical protein